MFSIQRWIGEKGKFFDVLEESAGQACKSVACLKAFLAASLHELLERAVDSCRDVSYVIFRVVLNAS